MTGMEFFVIDVVSLVGFTSFIPTSTALTVQSVITLLRANCMFAKILMVRKNRRSGSSWSTLVEMAGDNLYIITNYMRGRAKMEETMEFEPYNGVFRRRVAR